MYCILYFHSYMYIKSDIYFIIHEIIKQCMNNGSIETALFENGTLLTHLFEITLGKLHNTFSSSVFF